MEIIYRSDIVPEAGEIIELYDAAGLPRPTDDPDRIRKMFENSNLVVSAWDGDRLIGVCRTITDWVWSSYLADLAVSPDHKETGIGRKLIDLTREKIGEQSMILLLSVPTAMEYYPNVGFRRDDRAFIIERSK